MTYFNEHRRHQRADKSSFFKMVTTIVLLLAVMLAFWHGLKNYILPAGKENQSHLQYLPEPKNGKVYDKPYFSLSYVEQYELPEWVTYELTVDMMNKHKYPRDQDFNPDPAISTGSGHYHDYKSTGYRRGHLVPSADMAWNKEAMDATFLLSNVAPMTEEFNDGIWNELEQNVRDWSRYYGDITVVAGPVFSSPIATIGDNKILVPKYFYKAVFTLRDGSPEVIGFLFNQAADRFGLLKEYVVPIDSIENITGIDLFSNRYGNWDEEIRLEKSREISPGQWPFNERWYQQRIADRDKR